jgi:hypothetical protein
MRPSSLFAIVVIAALTAPAWAQAPSPGTAARVRGTIEKLDGQVLSVRQRDGRIAAMTLAPKATIQYLVRRTLADIKPGDFVASTGIRGKDGKIHAIEARIFPAALPPGGRQFPWDLAPDSVMTNATVGTVTKTPEGEVLHVTFKGGESEYIVGPEVPILAPMRGDASLLKPGLAVFVLALKQPDGTWSSSRLYVEKDGIKPPM